MLAIRYKNWGGQIPHRTAEDVAFAVGRFFQYGGTFQNYYMVNNCILFCFYILIYFDFGNIISYLIINVVRSMISS